MRRSRVRSSRRPPSFALMSREGCPPKPGEGGLSLPERATAASQRARDARDQRAAAASDCLLKGVGERETLAIQVGFLRYEIAQIACPAASESPLHSARIMLVRWKMDYPARIEIAEVGKSRSHVLASFGLGQELNESIALRLHNESTNECLFFVHSALTLNVSASVRLNGDEFVRCAVLSTENHVDSGEKRFQLGCGELGHPVGQHRPIECDDL